MEDAEVRRVRSWKICELPKKEYTDGGRDRKPLSSALRSALSLFPPPSAFTGLFSSAVHFSRTVSFTLALLALHQSSLPPSFSHSKMESLLTPSESHAFQSFLSSLDVSAPEWTLYSSGNPEDIVVDVPVPQAQGREALAKATKDLMSLDADRWSDPSSNPSLDYHNRQHPHQHYPHHQYDYQRQSQFHQMGEHQQRQRPASFSHDPFPFLHKNQSYHRSHHSVQHTLPDSSSNLHPRDINHLRPLTVPTLHHAMSANGHGQMHSASSSTSTTTSSATTPSTTTSMPLFPFSAGGSTSSTTTDARPHRVPSPRSKRQSLSGQASSTASQSSSQKQNLLSPSQKKANHIQSEQKRRANIRRGYEALCDTVPALREAIREEEERDAETRAGNLSNGRTNTGRFGPSGKPKRSKKKDGDSAAERIDGRAGPRSENVVLSKTIDYINDLLSERQALLARLQRARSALPARHRALMPAAEQPLWEREWKGGEGKIDGSAGSGGAGEGDEEEEEEEEESS
ncbi:hypothetical protein AX17_006611 [Amanita inopinata Kibby_2008]|nr:hypothetical protein AX17_006611 [Amanita inopinata Kibby_2008]